MSVSHYTIKAPEVQIGPTAQGQVRVYVVSERAQIPLDFSPDEAEALAERILLAATEARRRASRALNAARIKAL